MAGSYNENAKRGATAGQAASYSPEASLDLAFGLGLGTGYKTGLTSGADWASTLRPVSFKGVVFPATQVKNSSGRKLSKHVYPYRPGQEVVDLGRQPLTITVSAVFTNEPFLVQAYGKDLYPGRYEALLAAIHFGGSGELVHPVFGTLKAACESYNDTTQADELNTVRLEITFVEDDINESMPFTGTASLETARASAAQLDAFAAAEGDDTATTVGLTFSEVVAQVEAALATPGRNQTDVAAELEMARLNLRTLTAAVPALDQPINISAKADLAALQAALNQAGTEYLAGVAPVISYVTQTQTTTADIAQERYADPRRATEIERLNSIADPLSIPPGTELKIHAY